MEFQPFLLIPMNRAEALDYIREHPSEFSPAAEAERLARAFGASLSILRISSEPMPTLKIRLVVSREQLACVSTAELACALADVNIDEDMDATELEARTRRAAAILAKRDPSEGRSIPVER